MTDEILYQIALSKIPNIGPVTAKNLLSYCGSAKGIFQESKSGLEKIPGIGAAKAEIILQAKDLKPAERELTFIEKHGIQPIFFSDEQYPRRLKQIESAPIILFYKGSASLNPTRTVGIVGTRTPTDQGRILTEKLVEGLKNYGVTIISGLAYGIDAITHRKSVEHSIENIGVLGHGLDMLYPGEHRELASKMIHHGGLLTEFPSNTNPDKENFPMRNRIIAGMCDALIVIESKVKGGSIITAEFANDFNKDVFAVPGRPTDEYSGGCNAMIKKHKAFLLEKIDDLLYIMRWDEIDKKKSIQSRLFVELSPEEQKIVDQLRNVSDLSIDELCYRLQCPSSQIAPVLLQLEFSGVLRSLPGKRYMIN